MACRICQNLPRKSVGPTYDVLYENICLEFEENVLQFITIALCVQDLACQW